MEIFTVYEQRTPIQIYSGSRGNSREIQFKANIIELGKITASSIKEAFDIAKKRFMVKWPILSSPSIDHIVRKANEKE